MWSFSAIFSTFWYLWIFYHLFYFCPHQRMKYTMSKVSPGLKLQTEFAPTRRFHNTKSLHAVYTNWICESQAGENLTVIGWKVTVAEVRVGGLWMEGSVRRGPGSGWTFLLKSLECIPNVITNILTFLWQSHSNTIPEFFLFSYCSRSTRILIWIWIGRKNFQLKHIHAIVILRNSEEHLIDKCGDNI